MPLPCWIPIVAGIALLFLSPAPQHDVVVMDTVCVRQSFGESTAGRGFSVCGTVSGESPRVCVPARLPDTVRSLLPNTTQWCSQVLTERADGTTTRLLLPHADERLEPVVAKSFTSAHEFEAELAALQAVQDVPGTPVLVAAGNNVTIVEQVATTADDADVRLTAAIAALGAMHGATRGPGAGGAVDARRFRSWVAYLERFATANQVAFAVGGELDAVAASLAAPGPAAVLVHGDVCLDNVVGSTLVDFSKAGFGRHAALDAAAPAMGLPTCFQPASVDDETVAALADRYVAAGGVSLSRAEFCVGATYFTLLHLHEVHAKAPWDACGRRTVVTCGANVMARLDAFDRHCGGGTDAPFPRTATLLRRLRQVLAVDWAATDNVSQWLLPSLTVHAKEEL